MLPEGHNDQHGRCRHKAGRRQKLADPERSDVQAVRPQTLDPHSAQAIPCRISQSDLAVILPPLGQKMQAKEAGEIPKGFIQEGGVMILHLSGDDIVKTHPQERVGHRAKGLPVEEVAPATHALADEEAQRHQIQHGGQLHFPASGIHCHTGNGAQHAAIDGQTAIPDVQHTDGVGRKFFLPLEDAVISSGADNSHRHDPQHAIGQIVGLQAELRSPLPAVDHRQHQTQRDDGAVIVDAQGTDLQNAARIPLDPQAGERDGGILIKHTYPSVFSSESGTTTLSAQRSRQTVFFKNSSISSAVTEP